MKDQKQAVAVIGEGITEQYYILSLKDVLNITAKPLVPSKSTKLKDLEDMIEKCLHEGYSFIYCLIDMDNKQSGPEKSDYLRLKAKYEGPYESSDGGVSQVIFIENNPCTEIWFYYYSQYTTGCYQSYDSTPPKVKPDLLKRFPGYEKKERFFKSCGGLHEFFANHPGASLDKAVQNSKKSVQAYVEGDSSAYSQMHRFIEANGK